MAAEGQKAAEEVDFSHLYQPSRRIYVVKKDGSKELTPIRSEEHTSELQSH